MRHLRRAGTVVFDCDSTLSTIEGIDALADAQRSEIERLTQAAMDGLVPLEQVYGRRLELVRPDRARIERLGAEYIATLVPDALETVAALRGEGILVRVMSAGLRPAVAALAGALGIAGEDVAAVQVRFTAQGEYGGFDATSPLTRSGGKAAMLSAWRPAMPAPVVLVGDGVTDLEAKDVADLFVAFAGVVERQAVVCHADLVVRARSLAPILPIALAGMAPRDPAAFDLYERGMALLDDNVRAALGKAPTTEH